MMRVAHRAGCVGASEAPVRHTGRPLTSELLRVCSSFLAFHPFPAFCVQGGFGQTFRNISIKALRVTGSPPDTLPLLFSLCVYVWVGE